MSYISCRCPAKPFLSYKQQVCAGTLCEHHLAVVQGQPRYPFRKTLGVCVTQFVIRGRSNEVEYRRDQTFLALILANHCS